MIALEDLLAVPYAFGGRDPAVGLDCWGMVIEVRRRLGYATWDPWHPISDQEEIPQAAAAVVQMFADRWERVTLRDAEAGDVLVLPGFSGERTHAAVHVGGPPGAAMQITKNGARRDTVAKLSRYVRGVYRNREPLA